MSAPLSVVICDDSALARKQVASALQGWNVELQFANNGQEALDLVLTDHPPALLVLDLHMPILDGFDTLAQLRANACEVPVVVVSSNIQQQTQQRVVELGAQTFLSKPVERQQLTDTLVDLGLFSRAELNTAPQKSEPHHLGLREVYQEVTNVAMGRAGNLLAQLLRTYIELPLVNVNLIDIEQLYMTLLDNTNRQGTAVISQGFVGGKIAGEVLMIINESSLPSIAELLDYPGPLDETGEREILVDLASVLSGAFLSSFSQQINVQLRPGSPSFLGYHGQLDHLNREDSQWSQTLSIEVCYSIPSHQISCDLLLLFTEDSLDSLQSHITDIGA